MILSRIMNNASNESNNAPPFKQVSSLTQYVEWVNDIGEQSILFRGMANTDWKVESSLYRRLLFVGFKDVDSNIFLEMSKILINDARMNGHDIEDGRELKDLELLVKLQHYGAATCLIDFTKNSLVALYFACVSANNENDNKANGKVVAFDTAEYDEISINNLSKEIEHWFKENKKLWILSPKRIGNRVISQKSVFVFGSPILSADKFRTCEITNKKKILEELKQYGISAETLFDDFVGFSAQNSYNKEYKSWSTENYFMSGTLHYLSKDYESAIKCYDKEIKYNPKKSVAYYNRGLAKDNLGKSQDAINDYDEAIKLNPEYSSAYNNRGCTKNKLSDFQDAISDYDEAIRLNHEHSLAYNNRGLTKINLGNIKDAISDFDEAIRLNPEYYEAYNNRGVAKNHSGRFKDAISDFNDTIKLNPISSLAYHNRGLSKYNLGKFKDAINDYDEAIKLNSEYYEAYNNRGNAKYDLDNFQDAISDYDEAIKLDPKNWGTYYNRGSAKDKLGDKSAVADFAKAQKLKPKIDIPGLPPDNPNK